MALFSCASEQLDVRSKQESLSEDGLASPIPLPPIEEIDGDVCVEPIVQRARDRTLQFNGHEVVDLGIFHIHSAVEHTNTADACDGCRGGQREGHIVLGQESCRSRVLGRSWPDSGQGRKDRADALLGECAEAVLSFGVCLERGSSRVTLESAALWREARAELMCINLGGATGSHSPHQARVQWIHLREQCPRLAGNAARHSDSYEPGKLHVGVAAAIVEEELQDTPRCGVVSPRGCRECGTRHARCCQPRAAKPAGRRCQEGLSCEGPAGFERCLPDAPPAEH